MSGHSAPHERRASDKRLFSRSKLSVLRAIGILASWLYQLAEPPISKTLKVLDEADMRILLLLGGAGLVAWATIGIASERGWHDLVAYAAMFPMGSPIGWVSVYFGVGGAMIWLAWNDVPKVPCLLLGPVVIAVWSWAFFARSTTVATYQTGNATSLIYMAIGTLMIYSAGTKK